MADVNNLILRITDRNADLPAASEILSVLKEHPYFGSLALAWLRRTAEAGRIDNTEERLEIARRAYMANISLGTDYRYLLADLAGGEETDEHFYPEPKAPTQPDTGSAIDIFLDTYAANTDVEKESRLIEQLIFNPTVDYASVLAAEEERSLPRADAALAGTDDDLINSFILKEKAKEPASAPRPSLTEAPEQGSSHSEASLPPLPQPVPEGRRALKPKHGKEDSTLSESLAKMYIVRKNYKAAYEIINKLNLKYPEKSIYFAVQLRYLKKLILNQELIAKANA